MSPSRQALRWLSASQQPPCSLLLRNPHTAATVRLLPSLLCGLWGDLHRTRISRWDGRRVPDLGWSAVNWPPVSR